MNRSTTSDNTIRTVAVENGSGDKLPIPEQIRVLMVEDDPLDAELVLDRLREDGLSLAPRIVADEAGFKHALRDHRPDIVLSDLSLPGFSGERALKLLRERDRRLPFVFVSGTIGEEAAVKALRGGATDYILKNNMARLPTAVRRALTEAADRRARDAAEDGLVRSQRFETMAILAGSLSHDLRNILQPVLMASQLIENKVKQPEVARMCSMIRDCCNQGLELVSAMLALARGGEGARSNRIRLAALLEAVGLLIRPTLPTGVELRIEEIEPDLELPGNATELQQCLLNLVLNAAQAMPDGGQVGVAARGVELDDDFFAEAEYRSGPSYVLISVSDVGIGMNAETLSKLFTPFFTTKPSGNGLGLVSCRRFVEKHRGVIRVHSELGNGSRFDLYLPAAAPGADEHGPDGDRPGRGRPVLVLCDTGPLCRRLLDLLDMQGYAPVLAGGDSEAIRRLAESGGFSAAIVDAELAGDDPGTALDALRRAGFAGAVIVIEASVESSNSIPADLRLSKPLDESELVVRLAELVKASEPNGN